MGPYDLITLLAVLRVTKQLPSFWLRFFPQVINFETDIIAFDKVNANYRRLAPLVAPNMQGRVLGRHAYTTIGFAPAYVKPKHVFDPSRDLVRQAGEDLITGSLTSQQRYDAAIASYLQEQRSMIDNRIEWLAAQAIIYAKVTLASQDYPSVTVDFRRDPSLTITLAGTAMWTNAASNPVGDIAAARRAVNDLTGAVVGTLIFGQTAYANFWNRFIAANPNAQNNNYRGQTTELSTFLNGFEGLEYVGHVTGSNGATFEIWIYSAKYQSDDSGTLVDMMDPTMVVGVSDSIQGVQCYGAIRDKAAQFKPTKYFPKMWDVEDPSVTYIMTQSAPLMVPKQPNATFMIKTST